MIPQLNIHQKAKCTLLRPKCTPNTQLEGIFPPLPPEEIIPNARRFHENPLSLKETDTAHTGTQDPKSIVVSDVFTGRAVDRIARNQKYTRSL